MLTSRFALFRWWSAADQGPTLGDIKCNNPVRAGQCWGKKARGNLFEGQIPVVNMHCAQMRKTPPS